MDKEEHHEERGWAVIKKRSTVTKAFVCSGPEKIVICKTKERAEWWAKGHSDSVERKVVFVKIVTVEESL